MSTVLRTVFTLLGYLPLPVLRTMGAVLGGVLNHTPNQFRTVTRHHLARCLPELDAPTRLTIERSSLNASAQAILEAPAIWFGSIERRNKWIAGDAEALRIIRNAHSEGRGVIMLTPHQGAWELASFYCAQVAPISVLYKPQKGAVDAVIRAGRARGAPVHPVPTSGAGVKALLAALKAGNLIGILPDHDPPEASGTAYAPLFGIQAHTMDLVTKLAARTGAPVLYIVAERLPYAEGFRFHVLPASAKIADAAEGMTALNQGVEACIRLLPGQYWWSYRRYRRQPPGTPAFYEQKP